ncbi:MAG: hypothetical protein JRJ03_08755 [Deltaproteobacteria bacterium]|nr:hypothetical protein [Deltaproteobacteria bacterium]
MEIDRTFFGEPSESPTLVEPPPLVSEGASPEEVRGRFEGIAEIAATRGQKLE